MTTQEVVNTTENTPEQVTNEVIEPQTEETPTEKTVSKEEYDAIVATNKRLLEESQANKRKKQRAEEALLLKEGKKDEVIAAQSEKIARYEREEELGSVSRALAEEAKKRNCPDWDLMFNAVDSSVVYNKDTGTVDGVEEFFNECETDERLKRIYFQDAAAIVTDNNTPTIEGGVSISYKKDPLGYLNQQKAKSPEAYKEAVARLTREGYIS